MEEGVATTGNQDGPSTVPIVRQPSGSYVNHVAHYHTAMLTAETLATIPPHI